MKPAVFVNQSNFLNGILKAYKNSILLCDENTLKYCLPLLKLNPTLPNITINSGEQNKSLFTLNHIWNKLFAFNADRHTVLINLGGGMLTDVGGFAAATYQRGIQFINIPTTLMGMVDAANGGKTGINFNGLKNYLGTFTEPESIYIFPEFLKTLEFAQIQSGFAEMLKHGLIAHKNYFDQLVELGLTTDNYNTLPWEDLIKKSVDIKFDIVNKDAKEKGERKVLNFGHTIGHAMEACCMDKKLSHGHFVAAGMICETYLSHFAGNLDLAESQKIILAIDTIFKRINLTNEELKKIASLTLLDKKNKSQMLQMVLLNKIGQANYDQPLMLNDVLESLSYYNS